MKARLDLFSKVGNIFAIFQMIGKKCSPRNLLKISVKNSCTLLVSCIKDQVRYSVKPGGHHVLRGFQRLANLLNRNSVLQWDDTRGVIYIEDALRNLAFEQNLELLSQANAMKQRAFQSYLLANGGTGLGCDLGYLPE